MTDKEILQTIQALRACASGEAEECPFTAVDGCDGCPKVSADLIERLNAENAALREKVPQWISVEDRLPEPGVPVLVNYIGTDGLPYADGVVAWTDWGALWWEGSLADSESEVTVPITHWMPLPEAPEEGAI